MHHAAIIAAIPATAPVPVPSRVVFTSACDPDRYPRIERGLLLTYSSKRRHDPFRARNIVADAVRG